MSHSIFTFSLKKNLANTRAVTAQYSFEIIVMNLQKKIPGRLNFRKKALFLLPFIQMNKYTKL